MSHTLLRAPRGASGLWVGIVRRHRRFLARIWIGGRYRYVGSAPTETAAARLRSDWLAAHPGPCGPGKGHYRRPEPSLADVLLELLAELAPRRRTSRALLKILRARGRVTKLKYLRFTLTRLHAADRIVNDYDRRGWGLPDHLDSVAAVRR